MDTAPQDLPVCLIGERLVITIPQDFRGGDGWPCGLPSGFTRCFSGG
jgi:hypothetical protein